VAFKFIYGGAAEETENLIIDTGADANFFIGGVIHLDSNADNVSVYADGNSNSILTLTDFGLMEINIVAKDSTNWIIWGNTEGADAPAFTDQS
jgi:Ser/Thr protein kinase RdoA (MazF antagonist)